MDILGGLFNTFVYNPMLNAMLFLYALIGNYGIAIIVFTLLVGVVTMPFRIKSQQSMKKQQEKMAALKPKLDEIKKKYKDNPQQLQQAQMKLYQEHGMANPFNAGCLLTLLPFPIFIGMYQVINDTIAERPEQLMRLPQHLYPNFLSTASLVPVNAYFFGLNLGAVLSTQNLVIVAFVIAVVVGAQYVQTKMMQTPTVALDPQQAQMNQSMTLIMPLMFGFFVYSAPIGLSLYWITFSVIGILQQGFTGGWDGIKNLLPKPAPEPVRTRRRTGAPSSLSKPPVDASNGNESEPAAPAGGDVVSANKGKRKSGKKR
ncbi:MAG: membrane protein insertase YidC [Chloroflexi bacterium]|nr:membrane protein insertase YidC [Chloroflexota bacterium]